ncbi:MAG: protein translocase subunit SecD, partial [Kineosporiaceae bacterium]
MANQQRVSRPFRALTVLGVIIATLLALVAGGWHWDDAEWTPSLALDLEGGTEILLEPQLQEGEAAPSGEVIEQAVAIIRQRVNGSGVTEAEVARQGAENILVAIPGQDPDEDTLNLVRQSAQLAFRPVLVADTGFQVPQPTGDPSAVPTGDATAVPTAPATVAPGGEATAAPAPTEAVAPSLDAVTPEPFRAAADATAAPGTPAAS